MSLVGTRPILQDELQKYELHHRARIAIKPGITGIPCGLLRCIRSQIQSGRQQMRHWNFMRLSQEGKSLTELHGLQLPISLSAPDLMRRIRMLS